MKVIHWWFAVAAIGLLVAAGAVLGSNRVGCLLGGLAAMALGLWRRRERTGAVCRLKGLTWDRASFCRGWFITGATGSGKTTSGIRQLLFQIFTHERNFGGLCIDEKGRRFGRPYVFRPPGHEAQEQITKDRVSKIVEWNRAQGREIRVHPEVIPFLVCRGFSGRLGARPLQQVIEELVGNALKNDLLKGGSGSGTIVILADQLVLLP